MPSLAEFGEADGPLVRAVASGEADMPVARLVRVLSDSRVAPVEWCGGQRLQTGSSARRCS